VLVRVVVLAGAMLDVATGMAALDLDRRMADGESLAQPLLEVAHDVLGVFESAIAHHHMTAERDLVR
jgi:hypothetical protein